MAAPVWVRGVALYAGPHASYPQRPSTILTGDNARGWQIGSHVRSFHLVAFKQRSRLCLTHGLTNQSSWGYPPLTSFAEASHVADSLALMCDCICQACRHPHNFGVASNSMSPSSLYSTTAPSTPAWSILRAVCSFLMAFATLVNTFSCTSSVHDFDCRLVDTYPRY